VNNQSILLIVVVILVALHNRRISVYYYTFTKKMMARAVYLHVTWLCWADALIDAVKYPISVLHG
jgi:hypothetical protein